MSAASLLIRTPHQCNADKDRRIQLRRAWLGLFNGPGLFWCDAFLGRVSVSGSFAPVSSCTSQRFCYLCAIEEPVTRQPLPHTFVLLCLWAVFFAFLFLILSWHSGIYLHYANVAVESKWGEIFKSVLKMWDYEKLIQFQNAAADLQPSLKIDFILNVPEASLSLHAAMITARQIKTLNHLRRLTYAEDCFIFQYTELQFYCPSWWWREASWFPPVGEHVVLPSAVKKNLDASPATDPAANKWRDEKWPPRH